MIQKLDLNNEKVLAWRLEGKINEAELSPMVKDLEQELNTSDRLNIYMEVTETPGVTPQAFWDSLKSGLSNLKSYDDKLDKVAVVTDKGWLQTMASVENRFFPGIEERAFSFEEATEARQWVKA